MAVSWHVESPFGELGDLLVQIRTASGNDGMKHVLEVDFQMDAIARLDVQMFHVRLDAYFANFSLKSEVEMETII